MSNLLDREFVSKEELLEAIQQAQKEEDIQEDEIAELKAQLKNRKAALKTAQRERRELVLRSQGK